MRSLIRCAIVLSILSSIGTSNVYAQIEVVQKHRKSFGAKVSPEDNTKLLKLIAAEVKGGVLKKTEGNNCNGYSCDIICFADGRHFDVLRDSEGPAEPTWNFVGFIDPLRCELVSSSDPKPDPTEPEPTDDKLGTIIKLLMQQLIKQEEQNQALKAAIVELQKAIQAGVKIRF
jgi:hypothetical protein